MIEYNKGDLVGDLTFKKELPPVKGKPRRALFECPLCHKDFDAYIHNAKNYAATKCRKCWDDIRSPDITGLVSDRLTVIERAGKDKFGKSIWVCKCECGNTKIAKESFLKLGLIRSCGCLAIEHSMHLGKEVAYKHGMRGTSFYTVWQNMKARCKYETCGSYLRYGGRGIKVCERWLESFENFYADMFDSYEEDLQLDRKDNDGIYEKSNCRWVTRLVNIRNSSATKLKEEEALYIRTAKEKYKDLAERFNVTVSCVKAIKQNKIWKEI